MPDWLLNPQTIVTILAGLGGLYLSWRKIRAEAQKSRLIKSDAFDLPAVPERTVIYAEDFPNLDHYLVGREIDTEQITKLIQGNRLVFLDGPSGVGKSSLLKIGVARRLHQSGTWLPVLVDTWGEDWVEGPRENLADALELAIREGLDPDASKRLLDGQAVVTAENMFTVLSKLRDVCGRRPALIFDQLDDYQNRHMERFLNREHGEVISVDELSGRNPFWRDVRTGCLESGFHCVFSIRSDAGAGLAAVQFAAPKQRPLHGLAQGDVKTLIENLIGTQAVANPENGFEALKSRLADELSDGSERPVLPIQMRVVLGGLKRLKHLTPRDFGRANGLVGLESAYVDQRVRKTDNASQALSLLSRLVVEKGNDLGTVSKTVSQLSKECGVEPGALQAILETLEANNIVRRRAGKAHGEVWQLYHDYLARAVKALERKDRKWEDHLRESAKAHERASTLWAKWRTLLGPGRQIKTLFEKLRGKLVYGPHAGYAQKSLPRLVLNTWCAAAAVIGLALAMYWVDQRATEIVGAFNADDEMDSTEVQRVWELATSSGWVRQATMKRFLSNERYAEYFLAQQESLLQAAVGLDAELAGGIASSVLEGSCYERSPENSSIIRACLSLALYSDQDASRTAIFAVSTMGKTTDPDALGSLGQGLGTLGERLDPAVARQGAEAIVAAMGKTTSPFELGPLGQGLGALGERLDPAGARQVTEVIIATIKASALPPCSALAGLARDDELPLIVDMLKWPTCSLGDRNVLMEHVAQLQGVDPTLFGQYVEVGGERRFRADLWKFVDWAETQATPMGAAST